MINFFHTSGLLANGLKTVTDKRTLEKKLRAMVAAIGTRKFKQKVAEELVRRTDPSRVIPDVYDDYRLIVHDGILFFLSHIAIDRLVGIVISQLTLSPTACPAERLLDLAKKCPTLHKLGQLIARNQNIDARARKWLVHLENGIYDTDPGTILPFVEKHLHQETGEFSIQFGEDILSEASVGAVCPFKWREPGAGISRKGVFKVLKPGIRSHLKEELKILSDLAAFFENHRHRYPLNDFKFVDIFQDIQQALSEEINLLGEQSHLWEAYQFYKDVDDVRIPKIVPFSDRNVTAMEYMDGVKITDADMTPAERSACARRLLNAVILKPLFSRADDAIFHGDPHAGNILTTRDENVGAVAISLIDWSLAGHLPKPRRIRLVRLIHSVVKEDVAQICRSIVALAARTGQVDPTETDRLTGIVSGLVHEKEYAHFNLLKKAFWLVDQATRHGVVFPRDLLLFRKTLFTLEGIINELDPAFDIDGFMMKYLVVLILGEFPKRLGYLIFPITDTPENYQSLLSNKDLQLLFLHQVMECLNTNMDAMAGLVKKNMLLINNLFQKPLSAISATSKLIAACHLMWLGHSERPNPA